MQYVYPIVLALHAISTVFWAGATFVLVRPRAANIAVLSRPMLGAAAVAILSGGYLWKFAGGGHFGAMQQLLALGSVSALIAATLQGFVVLRLTRGSSTAEDNRANALPNGPFRVTAGLLAIAAICMVVARTA